MRGDGRIYRRGDIFFDIFVIASISGLRTQDVTDFAYFSG